MTETARNISHRKPKRRRWRRWIVVCLVGALLLVAAAPYLIQNPPLRDWIIDAVAERENVHAQIGGVSFGWLTPLDLQDLRIESPYGEPLLHVHRIRAERPWWQIALSGLRLGTFHIEEPRVTLIAGPNGWNFQDIGARRAGAARDEMDLRRATRKPELTAQLRDAAVSLHRAGVKDPLLDVDGVDATAHIKYVDGKRWLTVQPFKPLDRKRLTPDMCDNGLQLVAPILANASWVEGEISLAIDEFRLPLDRPRVAAGMDPPAADEPAARAAGRLELHSVETGLRNPLLQEIADKVAGLLGSTMPTRVRIANESAVRFELRDRRVYHEGLAFGLPEISPSLLVRTSGTVGLDKTLDLRADVPIMLDLAFNGALARRLSGKTIQLAVTGTLDEPKVSLPPEKSLFGQFASALRDEPVAEDGAVASDVLELAREVLPEARETARNVADNLGETLARIRERRAERRAARNAQNEDLAPEDLAPEDLAPEDLAPEDERTSRRDEPFDYRNGDAIGDALPPPPLSKEPWIDEEPRDEEPDAEEEEEEISPAPPRQGPLRRLFNRARRSRGD